MYEKIMSTVIQTVAEQLEIEASDITAETSLTDDLKVDSLDFVEICIALEDIYGIDFDTEELAKSMSTSTTVAEVVDYLVSLGASD